MKSEVFRGRNVFSDVLYAQCWEDPTIDRAAFSLSRNDVVFTITSGGCNALAFLLDNPERVIALDLNPHQNHILELKAAALRALSYGELLEFTGVIPSSQRPESYRKLRELLSDEARVFWDSRPGHVEGGLIHCGRFEQYIRLLGGFTRSVVGQTGIWSVFQATTSCERLALYDQYWDTALWKLVTRLLLSRSFMSLFFDKAFFAQLQENFSFGRHFEKVVRHAVVDLTPRESPFLSYALLGYFYSHSSLPLYLQEENVPLIRSRLDRLSLVCDDCASYFRMCPASSISRFNFTNIFEWMPSETFHQLLGETVRVATDGAVMTYRNLLVPRSHPEAMNDLISSRVAESGLLHERDRSFLYRAYVIEDIHKHRNRHVARRSTSTYAV